MVTLLLNIANLHYARYNLTPDSHAFNKTENLLITNHCITTFPGSLKMLLEELLKKLFKSTNRNCNHIRFR